MLLGIGERTRWRKLGGCAFLIFGLASIGGTNPGSSRTPEHGQKVVVLATHQTSQMPERPASPW
jgi:hypothetical protein